MLDTPHAVLQFLLRLDYPLEAVANALVDRFGIPDGLARDATREHARRMQEEDIEFAHTIIEHGAAVAAEWRE